MIRNGTGKTLVTYGLLLAIAFVMLLPLLWLVSTSLKAPTEDIFQYPPQLRAAIDAGCFFELLGDAQKRLPQQKDAKGRGDRRKNQA